MVIIKEVPQKRKIPKDSIISHILALVEITKISQENNMSIVLANIKKNNGVLDLSEEERKEISFNQKTIKDNTALIEKSLNDYL